MSIEQEEGAIIGYVKGMTARYYDKFEVLKINYISDKTGASIDMEVTSYVYDTGKIVTDKYKNMMNRFEFIKVETIFDVLVGYRNFKKGKSVCVYNTYEVLFRSLKEDYDKDILGYCFYPKRCINSYEDSIRFYEAGKENLINDSASEEVSNTRALFMKAVMNRYHEEQYEVYKDFENLDLF